MDLKSVWNENMHLFVLRTEQDCQFIIINSRRATIKYLVIQSVNSSLEFIFDSQSRNLLNVEQKFKVLGDRNADRRKQHKTRLPEKLRSITGLFPVSDGVRPDTHLIFMSYSRVSLCVCLCVRMGVGVGGCSVYFTLREQVLGIIFLFYLSFASLEL